jgi:DedD protein
MAKSVSEEAQQLKTRNRRRLIGAIAIVAGLVVFIPMLLDKGPKPLKQDIAINIPAQEGAGYTPLKPGAPAAAKPAAKPDGKLVTEIKPAATPETKPAEPTAAPVNKTVAEAPPIDVKRGAPQSAANDVAAGPGKTATLKAASKNVAPPATGGSGKYAVQIGVFSDAANVKEIQAKLAVKGFKSVAELIETSNGTKTRVRVTGYASKADAESALAKIHEVEKNAIVVSQQ